MKYEAKNNGSGVATSIYSGLPWTNIPRGAGPQSAGGAWNKCRSLGSNFDLISNDEWQTIARNIADVGINWSGAVAYTGQINVGHSDNVPPSEQAAAITDATPCTNTGTGCVNSTWNRQWRTHTLSNGAIIWDFGGNVSEWVSNDRYELVGTAGRVHTLTGAAQTLFGNDTNCAAPINSTNQYCGFGNADIGEWNGAYIRGSSFADASTGTAGIFATSLLPYTSEAFIGFRCVYRPPNDDILCPSTTPGSNCMPGTAGTTPQSPKYLGEMNGSRYMTTMSGCVNATNSVCNGGADAVTYQYANDRVLSFNQAVSVNDGAFNTGKIIDTAFTAPAGSFCQNLIWGGYNDWFLPAPAEMVLFQNSWLALSMNNSNYWTSRESAANQANSVGMTGAAISEDKESTRLVRCVRKYNFNP